MNFFIILLEILFRENSKVLNKLKLGSYPILKDNYSKVNVKIERMSKLIDLFLFKLQNVLPMAFFFLQNIVNFYIFDLGNESFYLPVRAMYVKNCW